MTVHRRFHGGVPQEFSVLLELDLNTNDSEALLRHCQTFRSESGDKREDRRLEAALRALAEEVERALALRT